MVGEAFSKQSIQIIPRWLTMSQACTYASVDRKTMRGMLDDGYITGRTTPGGHWRIDREAIDAYFGAVDDRAKLLVWSICA